MSDYTVELVDEKTFTIKYGSLVFSGFRIVSEWNGFMELQNQARDTVIVVNNEEGMVTRAFSEVFDSILQRDRPRLGNVVKASPGIIAPLMEEAKKLARLAQKQEQA